MTEANSGSALPVAEITDTGADMTVIGGNAGPGNRFRQKRFLSFLDLVDRTGIKDRPVRILDVGGRSDYWEALRPLWQDRDLHIWVVNLEVTRAVDAPPYFLRYGNACALPDYADNSFDIVHSNSVIEHVGHWPDMKAMAAEVARLAPHYFIQTPYLWFPLEAHYRSPFIQLLPEGVRANMLLRKGRGFIRQQPNWDEAMAVVQSINLLTADQLRALFPDARIERERVYGLTKSLIAIR